MKPFFPYLISKNSVDPIYSNIVLPIKTFFKIHGQQLGWVPSSLVLRRSRSETFPDPDRVGSTSGPVPGPTRGRCCFDKPIPNFVNDLGFGPGFPKKKGTHVNYRPRKVLTNKN